MQLVPIPDFVQKIPGRVSDATQELVFLATALPPLGIKSYYVKRVTQNRLMFKSKYVNHQHDVLDEITISNDVLHNNLFESNWQSEWLYFCLHVTSIMQKIKVTFNETSGKIKSVTMNGKETPLKQEFLWYAGFKKDGERASGAYIFRPNDTKPTPISDHVQLTAITSGNILSL